MKLYLLLTNRGRYYFGIALDPFARERVHNSGRGSKMVRGDGGGRVVAVWQFASDRDARRAEALAKRVSRPGRIALAEDPSRLARALHWIDCIKIETQSVS